MRCACLAIVAAAATAFAAAGFDLAQPALSAVEGAGARAEFNPTAWRMVRDITLPDGAAGTDARFALDADIWANGHSPDFPDLRILTGETEEVGFALFTPEAVAPALMRPPEVSVSHDGPRTLVVLDFGDKPYPINRIHLAMAGDKFKAAAVVEASADGPSPAVGLRPAGGAEWRPVLAAGAIFSFGPALQEKFATLSIPDTEARRLRVTLTPPPGAAPLEVTGAMVFREEEPPAGAMPLWVAWPVADRKETQEAGETFLMLDLGYKGLPVRSVTVDPTDEEFQRTVRVETSNDGAQWVPTRGGLVFRSPSPCAGENLTLTFPERYARYVRLRLADGGSPPVHFRATTVRGRMRYVFFPIQPGKRYRLFYGNPQALRPGYQYTNIFQGIDRQGTIVAGLGTPLQNPLYAPPRTMDQPPAPTHRWVPYLVLGLVGTGVALLVMRLLKRHRAAPTGPTS